MEDYENEQEEPRGDEIDDSENRLTSVFGAIVLFSFISVILLFVVGALIVTTNDLMIIPMYNIGEKMVNDSIVHSGVASSLYEVADSYKNILNYVDSFWLVGFITFVISSLVFSYFCKRENLFNIFSLLVFGIILLVYISGIFINLSNWLVTNLFSAFPTVLSYLPKFNWYLSNAGIINTILIFLTILANFLDLDLSKFSRRKDKEDLGEI